MLPVSSRYTEHRPTYTWRHSVATRKWSTIFAGNTSPNGELSHIYVYGLELIGQTRNYASNFNSNTQQIWYGENLQAIIQKGDVGRGGGIEIASPRF